MRILIVIPHFYAPHHPEPVDRPRYGADRTSFDKRLAIVQHCLDQLNANFIAGRYELDVSTRLLGAKVFRTPARHHLDVILCVRHPSHLLDSLHLPRGTRIGVTRNAPREIGFHCHKLLAHQVEHYDLFGYMEDDLAIEDPFFFDKIAWFNETFGDAYMLQPNRFEGVAARGGTKVYVDGPVPDEGANIIPRQFTGEKKVARLLAQDVEFEARENPMAGCFFMNRAQLKTWMQRPGFGETYAEFFGTMECAQILGPVLTFTVMKPSGLTSDFLEIRHLDPRLTKLKQPNANLALMVPPDENRLPPTPRGGPEKPS